MNAGHFVRGLAETSAGRCRPAEAARLLGAAEAMLQASGLPLHRYGIERAQHERVMATARAAIGTDRFDELRAQGRTLAPEHALAEALALMSSDA